MEVLKSKTKKKTTIIKNNRDGGLNMLDFALLYKALKIT